MPDFSGMPAPIRDLFCELTKTQRKRIMDFDFRALREKLRALHAAIGNRPMEVRHELKDVVADDIRIGVAFDGERLHVTAAKPGSGIMPWIMTFETEDHYDEPDLVDRFVATARAWFSDPPPIEREAIAARLEAMGLAGIATVSEPPESLEKGPLTS